MPSKNSFNTLLEKIIKLVIETTKAEKAYLILQNNQQWLIQASATIKSTKIEILQSIPIETVNQSNQTTLISLSIINYVINTQKTVILGDALNQVNFINDPYIIKQKPKSILSLPLMNKTKLVGIIYLENYLNTGTFTPEKLDFLNLLSTPVAIAIENATLYAEMRESHKRLTQFLEAIPIGIKVLDAQGKTYYTNQAALELLGTEVMPSAKFESLPETYNKTYNKFYIAGTNQLYPRDQLPGLRALQGEHTINENIEVHHQDRIIPLESRSTPIFDKNGNVAYVIVIFQDISKRKQAHQLISNCNFTLENQIAEHTKALRQNEERFQEIARTVSQFFFVRSATSGEYLYVSPAYEKMWGRTCESLYQNPNSWIDNVHPEDRDLVLVSLGKQFQGNSVKRKYRIIRADGAIRWVVANISRVRDETGKVVRFVGLVEDITEQKLTEAALEESIKRERGITNIIQRMRQTLDLETIFNVTTSQLRQSLDCDRAVIYRFNPDWSGEFIAESVASQWTPVLQRQTNEPNFCRDSLEGPCTLKDWINSPTLVADTYIQETRGGIYAEGVNYRSVEDIYQKDFTFCYIELLERFQVRAYIVVPIFCGIKLWGLIGVYQNAHSRDWSEPEINMVIQIGIQLGFALHQAKLFQQIQQQSVQLEAAKKAADAANRAKSLFLANMSHELRTPLNAILGFAQLMTRNPDLTPESKENLGIIRRSGEHLLTVINQVLDLSKIEAGRMTFNETNFDLHQLFNDLEDMFLLAVTYKGLELIFDRALDVPQYLKTDEVKLRQILINLLNNAIKFTSSGSVSLRVSTGNINQTSASTLNLYFEVEDTGSGIAPDELENIFEAFIQTTTGKQAHEGTGLGLAISYKFVKMMGGEMTVTSNEGIGTCFRFNIPVIVVVDVKDSDPQKFTQVVIGLEANQPTYRILIVDDVDDNRQLLIKLLRPLGFELQTAKNGLEAVEIWQDWEPHLIFMDIRMPVMDGYEATTQIKSTIKGKETAIIAINASVFADEREVILASGCNDFLPKPYQEADIFALINKHLGVRYVYEQTTRETDFKADEFPVLTPVVISALPDDWLAEFQQAIINCDQILTLSLINQIRDLDQSLANFLTYLARNFQFEELENILINSN